MNGPFLRRRILVISATFNPRYAYLENVLADAFHQLGHEVRVLSTEYDANGERPNWHEDDGRLPYEVQRIHRVLRFRETYLPWDGAGQRAIRDFDPELTIALAVNSGPGFVWTRSLPKFCRLVCFFSDLPWHRGSVSSRIKGSWARTVIQRADDVIAVTGQTAELIRSWAGPDFEEKVRQKGLAFDPQSLEGSLVPTQVEMLRHRTSRLIACITRVTPAKELDLVFDSIERFLLAHPDTGFVLAGLDSQPESGKLSQRIEASPVSDRCIALPMLAVGEVGALFRVADCSIWSLVSIGIYHSLYSGCPVLVRRGQDAEHLLAHPAAGSWFENSSSLDVALESFFQQRFDREDVQNVAVPYNAQAVARELVDGIDTNGAREGSHLPEAP